MSQNSQIISYKTKQILAFVFCAHCLFFLKLWHLSVIQKEEKKIESLRPQQKTLITKAQRGIITDRFGKPLVLNHIRYNATIYYGEISRLPTKAWIKDKNGNKIRYFPRKSYVEKLSKKLEKELGLKSETIEDLIYSKASLFPFQPFVIQENISEKTYFRIRMLEKDWAGLHAEISSERFYPQKHLASKIIGYLGAINQNEYLEIAEEIKKLELFLEKTSDNEMPPLPDGYTSFHALVARLKQLKEKAYSYQDLIGKSGIEAKFEEDLRGIYGKKIYAVDIKGNFLKELPGSKEATPGKNVHLSISSELQDFAEKLLAENEAFRDEKSVGYDPSTQKKSKQKQPWIKGGAIVAIDPNTHEVIALASYPTFDPNDFIFSANSEIRDQKLQNVSKWLETTQYIADIWDGKNKLTRRRYSSLKKKYINQATPLTWKCYLDFILPEKSEIRESLTKIFNLKHAIQVQEDVEALCYFFNTHDVLSLFDFMFKSEEGHIVSTAQIPLILKEQFLANKKKYAHEISLAYKNLSYFSKKIPHNLDKLLAIDLCKLAVFGPSFSDALIEEIGHVSIEDYFQYTKDTLVILSQIKKSMFKQFEDLDFKSWREEHFKQYLKEKRKQEKLSHSYAHPYTDYLEEKKRLMFQDFWKKHSTVLFSAFVKNTPIEEDKLSCYLSVLENTKKSLGPFLKEKKLFLSFLKSLPSPLIGDFLKTIRSFDKLDRPLFTKYRHIQAKKPLEKHLAALFHQSGGYGYMRSAAFQEYAPLGSIFKIVTAYEALEQRYKKNSHHLNPLTMIDTFKKGVWVQGKTTDIVGYSLNQVPYTRHFKKGRLPKSSRHFIGKIDLISAIEQTSNPYFSILAGEHIKDPEDLNTAARSFGFGEKTNIDLPGEIKGNLPKDLQTNRTGLYSYAIGQHTLVVTPLQTACFLEGLVNHGKITKPKIVRHISGKETQKLPFSYQNNFPLKEELESLGISFPILLFDLTKKSPNSISSIPVVVRNQVYLPLSIRNMLFKGMVQVVSGKKGTARIGTIKSLYGNPMLKNQYKALSSQVIGKTSSAEIIYNPYITPSLKGQLYKHIWFAGISFEKTASSLAASSIQSFEKPELIVIVYLKFGDWGKEAAPLAMQIIQKYREIKNKNQAFLPLKTKLDQNIQSWP